MAFENSLHYTNVDVPVSTLVHEDDWPIRDLYQRILTGEILDPHDACELLHGYLEDGDLKNLPYTFTQAFGITSCESIELLVRSLWNAAHDTALTWASEYTDTDRVHQALLDLHEDSHIDIALFSSIFDIDHRADQRGAGAALSGTWREFESATSSDLTIIVDSRQLDILISEIAINVADALSLNGLTPSINDDYSVTVPVRWRHHVLSFNEALEAAALIPGR